MMEVFRQAGRQAETHPRGPKHDATAGTTDEMPRKIEGAERTEETREGGRAGGREATPQK